MSQSRTELDPSIAIVERVAEEEGVGPTELDAALGDVIDPEALDVLVRSTRNGHGNDAVVGFSFYGYRVEVHSSGRVHVEEDAE